ncbi:MAG: hypothetical protein QM769_06600 [Pseudoxanthomonas sp.]
MTDLTVKDIDLVLEDRIRRIGLAHGWSPRETTVRLLELGLFHAEQELHTGFSTNEEHAMTDAITALQQVPGSGNQAR